VVPLSVDRASLKRRPVLMIRYGIEQTYGKFVVQYHHKNGSLGNQQ